MVRVAFALALLVSCVVSQEIIDIDSIIQSLGEGYVRDSVFGVIQSVPLPDFVECMVAKDPDTLARCSRRPFQHAPLLRRAIVQESKSGFTCQDCSAIRREVTNALLKYVRQDAAQCERLATGLGRDSFNAIHCDPNNPPVA